MLDNTTEITDSVSLNEAFPDSIAHLNAELKRLNLLIKIQVNKFRQNYHVDDISLQGLYIPDQSIDDILNISLDMHPSENLINPENEILHKSLQQLSKKIELNKKTAIRKNIELRLEQLVCAYQLSSFEKDIILIAIAPQMDLHYEKLYAYLQDDVTKKYPSIDLIQKLLCSSYREKLKSWEYFTAHAPLIKNLFILLEHDPSNPQYSLLGQALKLDNRIFSYLLGSDQPDTDIIQYIALIEPSIRFDELILPTPVKQNLLSLSGQLAKINEPCLIYFQGAYGVGKRMVAEAMCENLDKKLLVVNTELLIEHSDKNLIQALIVRIMREASLQNAVVYWHEFDNLMTKEHQLWEDAILKMVAKQMTFCFASGNKLWELNGSLNTLSFIRLELPFPKYEQRLQHWKKSLGELNGRFKDEEIKQLANKFRLSGRQVRDTVSTAKSLAKRRLMDQDSVVIDDLYTACRLQSNQKLEDLAQHLQPRYGWNDIVLPADKMEQLNEIRNHIKYRSIVLNNWGFAYKLATSKGLSMLFAGPSGTGKTMAAEVIAHDLALDLYKIDLSNIVSKYIGETEKNLAKIFTEAETSNAILFFDEADALFGKRSEVRDAHDRYANTEISYLLQRMEEYEGVVILTTNLSKNMDDAFIRRLQFIVKFTVPQKEDRRRIWEKIWPDEMPRDLGLDFDFLSGQFELSGGNIRNIALAAAFLAANDNQVVSMAHIIHAIRREYQKMGRVIAENQFGQYAY